MSQKLVAHPLSRKNIFEKTIRGNQIGLKDNFLIDRDNPYFCVINSL